MTLEEIRRVGVVLFVLCALPAIVSVPWGALVNFVLDAVTILMGLVLVVSFAWLIASSWRGTWHV